jgi:hypothetical protein
MTSPIKIAVTGAAGTAGGRKLDAQFAETVAQMRASPAIGRRMKLVHELLLESRRWAAS